MLEPSDFPPDHPARKLLEHQLRRSTLIGRISCAAGGCHECHETVIGEYADMVDTAIEYREITGAEIRFDVVGERAFELLMEYASFRAINPLRRPRGKPKPNDTAILRTLTIGRHVAVLIRDGARQEDAIYAASEKYHVSESTARDALRAFRAALVKTDK